MLKASYARTFWALSYRNLGFIFSELAGRLIDATIIVIMQTLAIGQFLPLLGMPITMIAPLFIGTVTQIVFSAAYGIAFRQVSDLHKDRFINYQMALPLPKTWLFASLIGSFMIEIAFVSLPLLFLGSVFLGSAFSFAHTRWLIALIMYLLSLVLYSLIFIYLAFNSSYVWFIDNVWARRLSPLFLLGCGYFTWKKLYAFNALLGVLFLTNPLTYVHEGLRAALLGQEGFLSVWLCMGMVILACALLIKLLAHAIQKKLDPV